MKHVTSNSEFTMVRPETVDEAGLLFWLCDRFKDQKVKLSLGTTQGDDTDTALTMWIFKEDEITQKDEVIKMEK